MNWGTLAQVITPLVALAAPILVYMQARSAQRADSIQKTVDHLQSEVDRLTREVRRALAQRRVLEDYAIGLRRTHPDPQPWPAELIGKD